MMRGVSNTAVGRVAWIAIAPVKSMALSFLESAQLGLNGIPGDRAFALLDEADRVVNGKRVGRLATFRPSWDPSTGRLSIAFPDGGPVIEGSVTLGEPFDGWFFGHARPVRAVGGPWSEALSGWAGRPIRLVALADAGEGPDRGPSATLLSVAALASLARAGGADEPLDRRRFRMTFGIDGVAAHAEDGWLGRDVRVGEAIVRPAGNVGRCAVTTHDPDTGFPSFDTLHVLQHSRGALPTSEPLPFGVWSEIVEPGEVRLGDPVGPV